MKTIIGVSNRHVHVTEEDLKILFGENHKLTNIRDLVQPGQFACSECVSIESAKGKIDRVRIIGPTRNYTQVEISKTDAIKLGLEPPVRDSGDLENSEKITIIGPNGIVEKQSGCIIANRHIHMTPQIQVALGLENVKEVSVKLDGLKGGILHHVMLKVTDQAALEFHIDTDDANAHLAKTGDYATIIKGGE